MKTLELELKKRLLIVEGEEGELTVIGNWEKWKLICKGYELTEDIANELVELHESTYRKDYLNDNNFFILPTESFISAIEAKDYCFGFFSSLSAYKGKFDTWEEAESKTFKPEKTLIFELL